VSRALRLTSEQLAKPVAPYERDIQASVRGLLAHHPAVARVFRINSGAHVAGQGDSRRFVRYHDIPGMSDLWVWLKGTPRQAFIEVKRPGEKPSDKQAAFLQAARELGHIAFVTCCAQDAWNSLTEALNG
jgi:hypothetical protein